MSLVGSIIGEGAILNQDPLGSEPGSINYDPVKGTMNVRNIFPGSSIQVGQENVIFVVNNSGATIEDGKVVDVTGYDVTLDALQVSLAIASSVTDAKVLGLTTTVMVDGAVGLVTVFGRVNDLDTSMFAAGDVLFISDTVAGDLTTVKPTIPIRVGEVGAVSATVGFIQVGVRELSASIYGTFFHSLNQAYTANVTGVIEFNSHGEISGITHDEVINNDEFTFENAGVYQVTIEPQYTRTSGGGTDIMNVFFAKDTGSGFVNVPDSTVKFTVNTSGATMVSPMTSTFRVASGDKISFRIQVEAALLILEASVATGIAPNDIPATPSVIMNIVRIGD